MGWCAVGTIFALTRCLLRIELERAKENHGVLCCHSVQHLWQLLLSFFCSRCSKYNKSTVQEEMKGQLVQYVRPGIRHSLSRTYSKWWTSVGITSNISPIRRVHPRSWISEGCCYVLPPFHENHRFTQKLKNQCTKVFILLPFLFVPFLAS
jgi:hypothetical protein